MKAEVSEGYEFGPIFFGPFPVTAEVGLAFTAEARFAMGYDTRGLRQVIAGGNPIKLFNGIFIDDLDANGLDVDEWKLTFRVSAEAALDLVIVEAGVYGGVDAILTGNLDDSPNPDGKLYIEEIVDKISNPICLFIITGKLDLFLGFFVEVDLFLWSDRWELEIIRVTLLDFTTGCAGTEPNLAFVDGGNLVLNMGTRRAAARGIQPDEINEEFTVRQIGPGKVSIEAFGIKEEESGITGIVIADAADGDDIIAFVKGGDDANPVAFTIGSNLIGGTGNDSFTGGDGDRYVQRRRRRRQADRRQGQRHPQRRRRRRPDGRRHRQRHAERRRRTTTTVDGWPRRGHDQRRRRRRFAVRRSLDRTPIRTVWTPSPAAPATTTSMADPTTTCSTATKRASAVSLTARRPAASTPSSAARATTRSSAATTTTGLVGQEG